MESSDFLNPKSNNEKFIGETSFQSNRNMQEQMVTQTIEQLRKFDVNSKKELQLEYFFYSDTAEKAEKLANEMRKLNYTVYDGSSAGNKELFVINGLTTKMKMSDEDLIQWSKKMCELGYIFVASSTDGELYLINNAKGFITVQSVAAFGSNFSNKLFNHFIL